MRRRARRYQKERSPIGTNPRGSAETGTKAAGELAPHEFRFRLSEDDRALLVDAIEKAYPQLLKAWWSLSDVQHEMLRPTRDLLERLRTPRRGRH